MPALSLVPTSPPKPREVAFYEANLRNGQPITLGAAQIILDHSGDKKLHWAALRAIIAKLAKNGSVAQWRALGKYLLDEDIEMANKQVLAAYVDACPIKDLADRNTSRIAWLEGQGNAKRPIAA